MKRLQLFLQSRSARVLAGFLEAGFLILMSRFCSIDIVGTSVTALLFGLFMVQLSVLGVSASACRISREFSRNHDERSILMTLRQSHRLVLLSSVLIALIWFFLGPVCQTLIFGEGSAVFRCLIPLVLLFPHYVVSRAVRKGAGKVNDVKKQDFLYGLLTAAGWLAVSGLSAKLSETVVEVLLVLVPSIACMIVMGLHFGMYQEKRSAFLQRARGQRTRPMSRKKIRRMLCFDDLLPALVNLLYTLPFMILSFSVLHYSREIGYSLFQAQAIYSYTYTYGMGVVLIARSFLPIDLKKKESRLVIERTFTVVMYMMIPVFLLMWQCTSLFAIDVALASSIRFAILMGFVYVWMVYFTRALYHQKEMIVIAYLIAGLVMTAVLPIWMYKLCGFEGGYLSVTIGCLVAWFLSMIKLQYRNPLNWIGLGSALLRILLCALCANGPAAIWKYASEYVSVPVPDGIVFAVVLVIFVFLYQFTGRYMKVPQLLEVYKNQSWKDVLFGKESRQ